jgi:hypothetical protein
VRARNSVAVAVIAVWCTVAVPAALATSLSGGWSSPVRVDNVANRFGAGTVVVTTSVSCTVSGGQFCAAVDNAGDLVTMTTPLNNWSQPENIDETFYGRLDGVSCPTTSFCAAVDDDGNVVTSIDPGGGASKWVSPVDIDGSVPLTGVSCPSSGFCAAVDVYGQLLTSTAPTGGASKWSAADIDGTNRLTNVSCASSPTLMCAAVDAAGNVLASSDPAGGAGAWSVQKTATGGEGGYNNFVLGSISCPTAGFCAAVGTDGQALTSTDPTGGAADWKQAEIEDPQEVPEGGDQLIAVSCTSSTFCAIADWQGYVVTSTDPGSGSWSRVNQIDMNQGTYGGEAIFTSISCASTTLCASVDVLGNAYSSSEPTTATWYGGTSSVAAQAPLNSVSCPNTNYCAAVDGVGNVVTSVNPAGGASAWTPPNSIDSSSEPTLETISCTDTPTLVCAAGDFGGSVMTSTTPDGTWSSTDDLNDGDEISGISCPTSALCVAVGPDGDGANVWTSTDPASNTWSSGADIGPGEDDLSAISCPTISFCAAVDTNGNVITTSSPTGPASGWTVTSMHSVAPFNSGFQTSISCPSAGFCAVAGAADVVASGDPGAAKVSEWVNTGLDIGGETNAGIGISCLSDDFCTVTSPQGAMFNSLNPLGGASTWTDAPEVSRALNAVSCPSTSLCVAVDGLGNVVTGDPSVSVPLIAKRPVASTSPRTVRVVRRRARHRAVHRRDRRHKRRRRRRRHR